MQLFLNLAEPRVNRKCIINVIIFKQMQVHNQTNVFHLIAFKKKNLIKSTL